MTQGSVQAVRVMTIHKAKGLEGRLVIVYGWASVLEEMKSSPKSSEQRVIELPASSPPGAFSLNWGPLQIRSSNYREALLTEAGEAMAEAKRLAYVAVTRAREGLVILTVRNSRQSLPEPFRSELEKARRAAAPQQAVASVLRWKGRLQVSFVQARSAALGAPMPNVLEPEERSYKTLWRQRYQRLKAFAGCSLASPSHPEVSRQEDFSRAVDGAQENGRPVTVSVGRLVHLYLERNLLDSGFDPSKLVQLVDHVLAPVETPTERQAARLLDQFYRGFLVDGRGVSYRERVQKARILGREVPFYLVCDGQTWHGVVDLVLEEEESIRAVDYKTTPRKLPLPSNYVQQRHIYTQALKGIFQGRPVDFQFWWLGQ